MKSKLIYGITTFTSSCSFLASSVIAIMVGKSKTTAAAGRAETETKPAIMNSPYHRIIFFMSISDIFQSMALIVGPFAVPSDDPSGLWAIGNGASCRTNGFFYILGSVSVPMYMLLICFHCLCKVKAKMTDSEFSRKIEWKAHVIIVTFSLGISISGLVTKMYHSVLTGAFCSISASPNGCRVQPEVVGECEGGTGQTSLIYGLIAMLLMCSSIVGVIGCMFQICWHVFFTMRKITQRRGLGDQQQSNFHELPGNSFRETSERMHRRQFLIQAVLYVSAFCFTYGSCVLLAWPIYVLKQFPPLWMDVTFSFCFPFGGLLNILVYTRPKVLGLRRKHPNYSWIRAFVLVVKAGVVLPPVVDDDNDEVDVLFLSSLDPPVSAPAVISSVGIINDPSGSSDSGSENKIAGGRCYYNVFPIHIQRTGAVLEEGMRLDIEDDQQMQVMTEDRLLTTISELENEARDDSESTW